MNKWIFLLLSTSHIVFASSPVWTFSPLTATSISVPANGTGTIQYTVTNRSKKTHTLAVNPINGISQDTSSNFCKNPFSLGYNKSCTLKLVVTGSQLSGNISGGPIVCDQASQGLQCYQPTPAKQLAITLAPPVTTAILNISHSPLHLVQNGHPGFITVTNTSSELAATNVTANITGTALQSNVTVDDSNCQNIAPLASCNLIFTPGSNLVASTNFTIQGTNTTTGTAAIIIQAGVVLTSISPTTSTTAGGTGVTLSGTGLSGATLVTIGGTPATSVNVVNSRTITAVTPAHVAGAVNVSVTTPSGTATLNNAYTYATSSIGQPTGGGVIACLNGGLNNLIAATQDNGLTDYGGMYTYIYNANSNTDGAANTTAIVNTLGTPLYDNHYAALICANYQIDSAGNSPCQPGNICYDDWFLPAGNNQSNSGQMWCLYQNRTAIGNFSDVNYWSSTQYDAYYAWYTSFYANTESYGQKTDQSAFFLNVRCVRAFTP